MDFLDPDSQRKSTILLFTGYILIGIAIGLAAFVLILVSYGFGVNKKGKVVQNGLVFVSSTPTSATIYLNGKPTKYQSNSRLSLPAGQYVLSLGRQGYRNWQRPAAVNGGEVVRFDYPLLIPSSLQTTRRQAYDKPVGSATGTVDNRWLMLETLPGAASFYLIDLTKPALPATTITVPAGDFTAGNGQVWTPLDWAGDNVHILYKHTVSGVNEFILVNRQDPTQTVNLNKLLSFTPTQVSFIDKQYDQYYVYSAANQTLSTASLKQPSLVPVADKVLAYAASGSRTVAYISPSTNDSGEVNVWLREGSKTYRLRDLPVDSSYLLEASQYQGNLLVTTGSPAAGAVFTYRDPISQLSDRSLGVAVPVSLLRLPSPNFVTFSYGGRFTVVENGNSFAVYDAEYKQAYHYRLTAAMDPGQVHATWLDGAHLQYVSGGELMMFDFDGRNPQTLSAARDNASVYYDPSYKHLYSITNTTKNSLPASELSSTALRTPNDM